MEHALAFVSLKFFCRLRDFPFHYDVITTQLFIREAQPRHSRPLQEYTIALSHDSITNTISVQGQYSTGVPAQVACTLFVGRYKSKHGGYCMNSNNRKLNAIWVWSLGKPNLKNCLKLSSFISFPQYFVFLNIHL